MDGLAVCWRGCPLLPACLPRRLAASPWKARPCPQALQMDHRWEDQSAVASSEELLDTSTFVMVLTDSCSFSQLSAAGVLVTWKTIEKYPKLNHAQRVNHLGTLG